MRKREKERERKRARRYKMKNNSDKTNNKHSHGCSFTRNHRLEKTASKSVRTDHIELATSTALNPTLMLCCARCAVISDFHGV